MSLFDRYSRRIHYLRISVTDRCNLRCRYCMAEQGVPPIARADILSFEELYDVTRAAVALGVDKVRLTGGEPLVRRGIVTLTAMLAAVPGIRDLAMTTNGQALAGFAAPLRQAGLQRVNVSLDALDPARYAALTRGGEVGKALEGIEAARAAGLCPIKVNCVVQRSSDEPDARDVARFAAAKGLGVQFIREMDLAAGRFWPVEGGEGGHCSRCNRLRLTSDGLLLPCLFHDTAFRVRELGPAEAVRRAVEAKPESGSSSRNNRFCRVGG